MRARYPSEVVLAITCASCSPMGGHAANGGDAHGLVGIHAPSFTRPGLFGAGTVSTDNAKGKVLIVDFWATYCKPCAKEFPKLQSLVDKHAGALVVYGLSEDEATDAIGAFAKRTGVRFPIGWDEGNAISQRYKLDK